MVDLQTRIDGLLAERREDLQILGERGQFPRGGGRLTLEPAIVSDGDPDYLLGEGSAGFGLDVYQRVICFTSIERYFALYEESLGVAMALRRILGSAARLLSSATRIAVAAGGFGDTDAAHDLAYYQGATFDEVAAKLEEVAGPPARTWDELARRERTWYLGAAEPDS